MLQSTKTFFHVNLKRNHYTLKAISETILSTLQWAGKQTTKQESRRENQRQHKTPKNIKSLIKSLQKKLIKIINKYK